MKILHVDDHELFAQGLGSVLQQREPALELLAATSAQDALLIVEQNPDLMLVIVDLDMPGLDGFALIQSLTERALVAPIVVLSATEDLWQIKRALNQGIVGFIPKAYSADKIVSALSCIFQGQLFIPSDLKKQLAQLPEVEPDNETLRIASQYALSSRQLDVLNLVREGYSNQEIADILHISPNTVKTHMKTLFQAFEVKSRIECVRYAEKIKLFEKRS